MLPATSTTEHNHNKLHLLIHFTSFIFVMHIYIQNEKHTNVCIECPSLKSYDKNKFISPLLYYFEANRFFTFSNSKSSNRWVVIVDWKEYISGNAPFAVPQQIQTISYYYIANCLTPTGLL